MKVKELIEKLQMLDSDLDVAIRDGNHGDDYSSIDVEDEEGVSDGAAAAVIEFLY